MQTIGHANVYYTLWDVSEVYIERVSKYEYYKRQRFTYIKNLSMDLEKAEAKVTGEYTIDLSLRGETSFVRSSELFNDTPDELFKFGKYTGCGIAQTGDISYTEWYHGKTGNPVAKDFLIANGYVEHEGVLYSPDAYSELLYNLRLKEHIDTLAKGHHFENGKRVELEIKEIDFFSFEGFYGFNYVVTYESKCGKLFKYMGSKPPKIPTDSFKVVKATIKHDEYKGEEETKLQRIK